MPALVFLPSLALADKLEIIGGMFSLTAQTSLSSGSKSGPGVYQIGYFHPLTDSLDVGVGYTLLMTGGVGGDLGFGPDIGAFYYPFGASSRQKLGSESMMFETSEGWRPNIGFEFQQRNFQATKAVYAGFAVAFGIVKSFSKSYDLKGEVRYGALEGPDKSTATEMDILAGISMPF